MDDNQEKFCSLQSFAAGEPLFASAGRVDVFLLLEYTGAWEDKALEKSSLPEEVKIRLIDFSKSLPAAKVLLIKQGTQSAPFHFYVVVADQNTPRLYRFELNTYLDLLDLDLAAIVQGGSGYAQYLSADPVYLVCTNGRRDQCCAKYGHPVFETLQAILGPQVWECSHLGGHRFAANLYHLPYGMLYGRLQPEDISRLVAWAQSGKIDLDHLRGCTASSDVIQAAEYYLRRQTGELALGAYRLGDLVELEPAHWQVRLFSSQTGEQHVLKIVVEKTDLSVYESCTMDKLARVKRYLLDST